MRAAWGALGLQHEGKPGEHGIGAPDTPVQLAVALERGGTFRNQAKEVRDEPQLLLDGGEQRA